jgi:twitching motility protein PilT
MIREGKTYQIPNIMQVGQSQGMQTMDMSLERLVDKGTISAEVAMEKAIDKETFQKLMTTKKGVKPAETH